MIVKILILIFVVLIVFCLLAYSNEQVTVKIKSGQINGFKQDVDGKQLDVFLGIPYAQPPLGELRFRKPIPKEPWEDPILAFKWSNPCIGINEILENLGPDDNLNKNFSEDCLYLNIWSPGINPDPNDLYPVLVFIHGGSLIFGASSQDIYDARILAAKQNVIVVTLNYRLNIFGFLYTGTDVGPGNMGLWDQTLALEWVNDNIKYFGGDDQRITLLGSSGGSWSVGLHYLSPASRNLYVNAIMMSGAPIIPLVSTDVKTAKSSSLHLAQRAGCGTGTENEFTEKAIQCLIELDANQLHERTSSGFTEEIIIPTIYGDEFMPQKPIDMLLSGDYKKGSQLLAGVMEDEGAFLFPAKDPLKYGLHPYNFTLKEAKEEIKKYFKFLPQLNGDEVAKFYLTGIPSNNFNLIRKTIGVAFGDWFLFCPTLKFAQNVFKGDCKSEVYHYYWNYKRVPPQIKELTDAYCHSWMGVCHATDLWAAFGSPYKYPDNYNDVERRISDSVMETFAHFSRFGRPGPRDGAEWSSFYNIKSQLIMPYYEFTHDPKRDTYFGKNIRQLQCNSIFDKFVSN